MGHYFSEIDSIKPDPIINKDDPRHSENAHVRGIIASYICRLSFKDLKKLERKLEKKAGYKPRA